MGVSTSQLLRDRFFQPLHLSWRLGSLKLRGLREDLVHVFLILSDAVQSGNLFPQLPWKHSLSITAHSLQCMISYAPVRSPRDSLQPETCRTASSFWSSVSESMTVKGQLLRWLLTWQQQVSTSSSEGFHDRWQSAKKLKKSLNKVLSPSTWKMYSLWLFHLIYLKFSQYQYWWQNSGMVLTQIFYFNVCKYMACSLFDCKYVCNLRAPQPGTVIKYWNIYVNKYETKLSEHWDEADILFYSARCMEMVMFSCYFYYFC